MGRMQKGEYDSPVRIWAYNCRGESHSPQYCIRPYAMHKYPLQNSRYTVKCFTPGYETFGGIPSNAMVVGCVLQIWQYSVCRGAGNAEKL
jgi:hypothetical protein